MVDNTTYRILGNAPVPAIPTANQTAVEWSATRTSFLLTAGPVEVNATFLNPIEVCREAPISAGNVNTYYKYISSTMSSAAERPGPPIHPIHLLLHVRSVERRRPS